MSPEENELTAFISVTNIGSDDGGFYLSYETSSKIAKAIIERYPQIVKKPVQIQVDTFNGHADLICDYEIANNLEKFKQEHYVEVDE